PAIINEEEMIAKPYEILRNILPAAYITGITMKIKYNFVACSGEIQGIDPFPVQGLQKDFLILRPQVKFITIREFARMKNQPFLHSIGQQKQQQVSNQDDKY